MALVGVDLGTPAELISRWAAHAAVMAAMDNARLSNAAGNRLHFDDAGGNWVELVLLGEGRAVLFGHDHEYSDTYYREAAAYFQEEETDLLAEAPDWWGSVLPTGDDQWIGFVYGFDGEAWSRAEYDLSDGFASVGLPAESDDRLVEIVQAFVAGYAERKDVEYEPTEQVILALAASGAQLTLDELAGVFGPVTADLTAGQAAAALVASAWPTAAG